MYSIQADSTVSQRNGKVTVHLSYCVGRGILNPPQTLSCSAKNINSHLFTGTMWPDQVITILAHTTHSHMLRKKQVFGERTLKHFIGI